VASLKRVFNGYKEKIKTYCSFSDHSTIGGTKLKFLDADLKSHLKKCLEQMLPFRLYQMEKMVKRSERNATIEMTVVSPQEQHHVFNKELCHQYCYNECSMDKVSYYVYSLLEAICFQCGFFTWEDIREYYYYTLIKNITY
jgi:hypothetical protein